MSDVGMNIATGDPVVDAIVAGQGLPAGAADQEENGPIGGMWAGPQPRRVEHPGGPTIDGGDGIGEWYSAEYVQILWNNLPLEDRIRLQDSLVTLGLARQAIPGEFDDGTVDGLTRLLSLSNRSGTTWQATIGRLRSLDAQGLLDKPQQDQEFEPAPRLAPDYATLAEDVKGYVRQRLGRDPDDYEIQQLTSELSGYYALEHEAANEFASIQHEQRITPGVQAGGTVSAVDPMARFRQHFESEYKHELDFVEDKKTAQKAEAFMQGTVDTVSRASRGQR